MTWRTLLLIILALALIEVSACLVLHRMAW